MWVSWESDVITVISYSPLGDCAVSHIPLYKGNVNGKSTVVYDEVPNPCYNEYICYISPLLCLRGQELQQRVRLSVNLKNEMSQCWRADSADSFESGPDGLPLSP